MYSIARAHIDRRLRIPGTPGAGRIELRVEFQFLVDVVPYDQASQPAVWSQVHELITAFQIHIDGTELLREFDGKEEACTGWSDLPLDRVVGIVYRQHGKNRECHTALSGVIEAPLHPEYILPQSIFHRLGRVMHPQPCALVGKLNAISHAEIDVHVRSVRNGLAAVEKWHIAEVDLPVLIPGSSGIVGVIRRSSLGEHNPRT